jgi:hypothetical protein
VPAALQGRSECFVGDEERTARIDRLLRRFSEATGRKAALMAEAQGFAARIGDVRKVLGNRELDTLREQLRELGVSLD